VVADNRVVDDQIRAFCDRRAAEYDDWWPGTGLFAGRTRAGWAAEVRRLEAVPAGLPPARVLDVACGTGFLTRHLRGEVVGLDQSPRMVAVAAARLPRAAGRRGRRRPPAVRRPGVRPRPQALLPRRRARRR
jgi:SAM-dependent methyltransferase